MDGNILEQILRVGGLCNSIQEGIEYYLTHKDEVSLFESTKEAIGVVAGSNIVEDGITQLSDSLLKIMDNKSTSDKYVLDPMNTWYKAAYDILNKRILLEMKPQLSLAGDQADALFQYMNQMRFRSDSYYSLLITVCLKAGFSSPELSFIRLKEAFNEWPEMLKSNMHEGYVYKGEPQRIFESCPVCGGAGRPYFSALSYYAEDFDNPFLPVKLWMKCEDCDTLYTRECPESYLGLSEEFKLITPSFSTDCHLAVSGTELSIWGDVLDLAARYTEGKKLLEVGIGHGALLAVGLEKGYEVQGVELIEGISRMVADALDISIWNGDFLKYSTDEKYSVITMGDVIEHLISPEGAIRKAYDLLEEDGVLWLSTPNYESSFSRMRKFDDPMWKEPGHLTYFSYNSLRRLLEKCGFRVLEYKVSNRYNGSMELLIMKKSATER